MAGPIQTISYFARRLIQLEQKFVKQPHDRLPHTAILFRSFSLALANTKEALIQGRDLVPACQEFLSLFPQLELQTTAEMGSPEAEKLLHALKEAMDPERLRNQIETSENRNSLGEELEKAIILVRALADGLYIGAT